MKFFLGGVLLICVLSQVRSQMTCRKCTEKSNSACTEEEKCSAQKTQCLAIHWGTNQDEKKKDSYTKRCATKDECLVPKFCDGNRDCSAKCCDTPNCDPFAKPPVLIYSAKRSFTCYACSGESLESCLSTDKTCEDDENACLSFLLEGGNQGKVYAKRCARKEECTESARNRLCELEKDQSRRKSCRSSCCYFEKCNDAVAKSVSLVVIGMLLVLAVIVLQ